MARELTSKVYSLTKKAKFTRDFGLQKQIQDAASVTVHGFIGSMFIGSTNKDNVESHQWRETCERMKKTTLNGEL